MFRASTLGLASLLDWPVMKSKAGNCLVILEWITEAAARVQETPHQRLRSLTLRGFNGMFETMRGAGLWLSDAEAARLLECREMALLGYNALAREAAEHSQPRWVMKPKMHM
eukprot:4503175-Alexandrium_andersonii.AAC.1